MYPIEFLAPLSFVIPLSFDSHQNHKSSFLLERCMKLRKNNLFFHSFFNNMSDLKIELKIPLILDFGLKSFELFLRSPDIVIFVLDKNV